MSAITVDQRLEPQLPPCAELRPLRDAASPAEEAARSSNGFRPWELHSELVLVDPELRLRSLQLLPEPALAAPGHRPTVMAAPANGSPARTGTILGYAVRRIAEMTRFGLVILGAVFALMMLAELLSR